MKTKKSLIFSSMIAFSLLFGACGDKTASKEDCEKFAEHVLELGLKDLPEGPAAEMAKKFAENNKAAIIGKCTQEKVMKKTIDCAMNAQSLEEVAKCDAPTK